MSFSSHYYQLQYEHEVLWAKYEIREHYLGNSARNIYENIGQMLHVIRLQLSMLTFESEEQKKSTEDTGELVGQVMRDLRYICRGFYPAPDLPGRSELLHILHDEMELANMEKNQLQITGIPRSLQAERETIVSRMLQEMFLWIRKQESEKTLQVSVIYGEVNLIITLAYVGSAVAHKAPMADASGYVRLRKSSLLERAELIGASLSSIHRKNNQTRLKLLIPFKACSYE